MTNDEIRDEIKNRREQIELLKDQIRAIEGQIAELKQGFAIEWKVGDRYETHNGQFQIMMLSISDKGEIVDYKTQVSKIKKDGTAGCSSLSQHTRCRLFTCITKPLPIHTLPTGLRFHRTQGPPCDESEGERT